MKHDNILIGDNFNIKIIDFGISCIAGMECIQNAGSNMYIPTEIKNNTPINEIDYKKYDVYS